VFCPHAHRHLPLTQTKLSKSHRKDLACMALQKHPLVFRIAAIQHAKLKHSVVIERCESSDDLCIGLCDDDSLCCCCLLQRAACMHAAAAVL
jgi:hypothetical protein